MKYALVLLLLISNAFAERATKEEALSSIKELAMGLKKELKAAIKAGGPMNALTTCNTKAMPVTEKIQKKNISVGRVSTKNRNPNNTPKEWMKSYIEQFHEGKIEKKFVEVKISDSKSGILMPIKTGGLCLTCHGEKISSKLGAKIKELYPEDKALGYKPGEIRGFFWAEY